MITVRKISSLFVCLVAAAALTVGCRAPKASVFKPSKLFSMKSAWPWRDKNEPEEGMPVRVVGAWTDTVLTQPGQKPQRGFGGRLVFYEKDNDKPILVEGQLVVYAFDETGREQIDNKPTRRYVFPPDQVPLHMSMSEVGASYSFWLPWDEAGGARTEVSLICRFEPKDGAVVTSEQTRHLLPGTIALQPMVAANPPPPLPEGVASRPARPTLESLRTQQPTTSGVQPASYESAIPAATAQTSVNATLPTADRRMSVTSITLPADFKLPVATSPAVSTSATSGTRVAPPPTMPQMNPQLQPAAIPQAMATPSQSVAPAARAQISAGIGSPQLARPQIVTPQFMTIQPLATPATTTVTPPAHPAPAQPPAR